MEYTAKQTWKKLEEMFAAKLLSNKLFMKEELHSLKMEEGASMMEHVSTFNSCIVDLQKMNDTYVQEGNLEV
ncbi:PREDICTED: Retrovirus-related Pol poly from transposon TNT [Prunus dulcis]|uniref:PREDICTED: Retrovirus-related Pol poly from transposon TNT n=1 Tax=Prunus dulcis TaxID=3755 RepID=A0A5E4EM34_PRUDU|nr:PREDICTED: Retrovirus-related Pol poly from transposon TNT [Prunus dulcis]